MAHFISECGGRAQSNPTRLGTKQSGAMAMVASWAGACRISVHWNEKLQEDILLVELAKHQGSGVNHVIYLGSISEFSLDRQPVTSEEQKTAETYNKIFTDNQ